MNLTQWVLQEYNKNKNITVEQLKTGYTNLKENWVPVKAPSVKQWLAETGLREKFDLWLEQTVLTVEQANDPQNELRVKMRSGVKMLLNMEGNDTLDVYFNMSLFVAGINEESVPLTQEATNPLFARARASDWTEPTNDAVENALVQAKKTSALEQYRTQMEEQYQNAVESAQQTRDNAIGTYESTLNDWNGVGNIPTP